LACRDTEEAGLWWLTPLRLKRWRSSFGVLSLLGPVRGMKIAPVTQSISREEDAAGSTPNPYEVGSCQEPKPAPRAGFPLLSRAFQVRRRRPPAACPDAMARCRCRSSVLPHTRMEARLPWQPRRQRRCGSVRCGLATDQCPCPVLGNGVAAHVHSPVRARCGGRPAPTPSVRRLPMAKAPEGAAKQRPREPRDSADGLLGVQPCSEPRLAEFTTPGAPLMVQGGGRLTHVAP
jgi:hypothetical protein